MKKLILVLISCITVYQAARAQTVYEIRQAVDFFNSNRMSGSNWRQALNETEIEGSPFLNDDFTEGSVYTTSKTQFVGIPLRFNIFNDQVEFKTSEGQVMALAVPEVVEKLEIGEQLLEYVPYSNANKIRRGFFVVLEKGPATLYARPRVLFKEAKKPAAYQEAQPAQFIRKPDEYYIRIGQQPAQPVTKRKDIVDVFSPDVARINTFIETNRIKPDNKESLLSLVRFYNSL